MATTEAAYHPVSRLTVNSQTSGELLMHSHSVTAFIPQPVLAAHGDVYTERWDCFGRATFLGSARIVITGLNANITVVEEFRYTQQFADKDSAQWSAWLPVDNSMQTMPLNPALPTWVEWRYTRQDVVTDPGAVSLGIRQHSVPVDLTATEFHGIAARTTMYADIYRIVEAVALDASPSQALGTVASRPLFQFFAGHPDKCQPDSTRPVVYVYRIDVQDEFHTADVAHRTVQFRVGMKRQCSVKFDLWNTMRSAMKERFGLNHQEYRYSFSLNGAYRVAASFADLGVKGVRTFADTEVEDGAMCGCTRWEMGIECRLAFELQNDVFL